jgi:hypothetical protein
MCFIGRMLERDLTLERATKIPSLDQKSHKSLDAALDLSDDCQCFCGRKSCLSVSSADTTTDDADTAATITTMEDTALSSGKQTVVMEKIGSRGQLVLSTNTEQKS